LHFRKKKRKKLKPFTCQRVVQNEQGSAFSLSIDYLSLFCFSKLAMTLSFVFLSKKEILNNFITIINTFTLAHKERKILTCGNAIYCKNHKRYFNKCMLNPEVKQVILNNMQETRPHKIILFNEYHTPKY
jgi:hypothetical protein